MSPFPSSLLLALIVLVPLLAASCSWFERRKPAPKLDAERVTKELRAAVEKAGEPDIWIKTESARPGGNAAPQAAIEVVATPHSFDHALAAAQGVAAHAGLAMRLQPQRSGGGRREIDVRFTHGRQLVGRWKFREVPRLLRAAIIIDDLGNDADAVRKLLELPYPLTFSVLPGLEHSARTADEAYAQGRAVMLHLPMEPEPGAAAKPGPGEIRTGMTGREVEGIVDADLASVPHAAGVNNHMGSRATANAALMAAVMKVLASRGLFFVDSRTTAATTALEAARRRGVPAFYRSVFLDDTETVDYTLGQLRLFRRDIEEKGAALAIGHPHPTTIAALARFLPELEREDIELVPASELVRLPEVARLSPPPARRRVM